MDIIVIAEYVRSMPWSGSIWASRIARAMADRGHRVVLACDGIEDAGAIAAESGCTGSFELLTRRPRRTLRGADPLGFLRWSGDVAGSAPGARTISLTRYAPGELWIPLGDGIASALRRAVFTHRPASAAMEVLHRPWAAQAWIAERRASARGRDLGSRRCWIGTSRERSGWVTLGLASAVAWPGEERAMELRCEVRRLLGISAGATVLLTSAVHTDRPGLSEMLAGIAHLRRSDERIELLIVGRKTHTIRTACDRAGLGRAARLIGGTDRMDAALAACDIALAPQSRPDPASTGRFIADALRMGRPVLASAGAAGAELLRDPLGTAASAGMVLEDRTAPGWASALGTAGSPSWRAIASARARAIGAGLGMDAMAVRIERLLGPNR